MSRVSAERYRAFISYSHSDRKAASRLLGNLQSYRLPRGVAPAGKRRLGEFFMDREALPVAESLSAAILDGLRSAQAMIVLCSSSAAASNWVSREIREFRSLKPDAPIYSVIIDEGRDAESDIKRLIPGELFEGEREPLSADLRPSGDGYRHGFLKIVSALAGIPLEQLLQKEAKRRMRRVMLVTAGTSLIAVSMTVLAIQAEASRREAKIRQAEAEGMMDFMLNDLKKQLEPVGRLDVLEGVADQAVAYYDAHDLRKLDCDAVVRNARAFHLATEVLLHKNEIEEASEYSRRALALIESKRSACARDPGFMVADGHSEFWAASPVWRQADAARFRQNAEPGEYVPLYRSVIPRYENYDKAIAPLREADPALYAQEHADNQINLGSVYDALNDPETARVHFDAAIEAITPIALEQGEIPADLAGKPDVVTALFTLANAHGWKAATYEFERKNSLSLEHRLAERDILRALTRRNPSARDNQALALELQTEVAILRLRVKLGDITADSGEFVRLRREIAGLVETDPENDTWKYLLDNLEEARRTNQ